MKEEKVRLDLLLVERALVSTREKAKALLMSGQVWVDGVRRDKAGQLVSPQAEVEIRGRGLPFASRGGLKLEKALQAFALDPQGLSVIDLGASTGGFTDCLLKAGASLVYAVDVGKGLLDYKLRQDERVVVMDRTNARYLEPQDFRGPVDLISMDLSFISLRLVLPAAKRLLQPQGRIVPLIKPQFEAGPEKLGKGGVVRNPEVHVQVLEGFWDFCHAEGLALYGLTFSPIKGPAGNIAYVAWLGLLGSTLRAGEEEFPRQGIRALVAQAWEKAQ